MRVELRLGIERAAGVVQVGDAIGVEPRELAGAQLGEETLLADDRMGQHPFAGLTRGAAGAVAEDRRFSRRGRARERRSDAERQHGDRHPHHPRGTRQARQGDRARFDRLRGGEAGERDQDD